MSPEAALTPTVPHPPGALASAAAFLRRGVRPDGTHEDGSDWEIASHQWGLFISWSYHRGVALPATLAPEREGGREHDLLFDAPNARWLKFTKPFSAGFTVDRVEGKFVRRPATPLEYLQRWQLGEPPLRRRRAPGRPVLPGSHATHRRLPATPPGRTADLGRNR